MVAPACRRLGSPLSSWLRRYATVAAHYSHCLQRLRVVAFFGAVITGGALRDASAAAVGLKESRSDPPWRLWGGVTLVGGCHTVYIYLRQIEAVGRLIFFFRF